MFQVRFTKGALKTLKKMDRYTQTLLLAWIEKNIENCENPRIIGKALKADRSDEWRYRVGDYRIICRIEDIELIILVIDGGHRRDIYK